MERGLIKPGIIIKIIAFNSEKLNEVGSKYDRMVKKIYAPALMLNVCQNMRLKKRTNIIGGAQLSPLFWVMRCFIWFVIIFPL